MRSRPRRLRIWWILRVRSEVPRAGERESQDEPERGEARDEHGEHEAQRASPPCPATERSFARDLLEIDDDVRPVGHPIWTIVSRGPLGMLRAMKLFLSILAVLLIVGCGAIQNADREVNKKTDHGPRGGSPTATDGGDSPVHPGKDAGSTSL